MKTDSMRLVLAGGMIGLLVLSAAAWQAVRGLATPPEEPETGARAVSQAAEPVGEAALVTREADSTAERTEAAFGEAAVPIFAEDDTAAEPAGPYVVALRVTEAIWGEKLFVCDEAGCPLEEIAPDRDGDQSLGPLSPGRYGVFRGGTKIGSFRLFHNAALGETEGRLWTDGELLYVERYVPGTARLRLTLARPGYYSFRLCDRVGREWTRDLYIPEGEWPDQGGGYERALEFQGLPPGLYTLVYNGAPAGQTEVRAGETVEFEWTINN